MIMKKSKTNDNFSINDMLNAWKDKNSIGGDIPESKLKRLNIELIEKSLRRMKYETLRNILFMLLGALVTIAGNSLLNAKEEATKHMLQSQKEDQKAIEVQTHVEQMSLEIILLRNEIDSLKYLLLSFEK